MKKKILYVEDEPFLGKVVKETLEFRGYKVILKNDGAGVIAEFNRTTPDICILDVMLPNVDGFTLCRKIREKHPAMPVIFLTAKGQTTDLVEGFESGGTDYIRKPFSIEELILRIENQLKLHSPNKVLIGDKIDIGNFMYDQKLYELRNGETIFNLTYREAQVLNLLVSNSNGITERKTILRHVWGDDSFFNSRTLDVYIRKLREYFESDPRIRIITLKGKGYHFISPLNPHVDK